MLPPTEVELSESFAETANQNLSDISKIKYASHFLVTQIRKFGFKFTSSVGNDVDGLSVDFFSVSCSSLSSVQPPDIWYRLQLPEEVVHRSLLSALQLEAVVYACQQHETFLADGSRAGFLIGMCKRPWIQIFLVVERGSCEGEERRLKDLPTT